MAVFFVLFLCWRYTPLAEYATAERVAGWAHVIRHSEWAPFIVIGMYTPAAFIMFPRPLITLFTVLMFGPWRGFVYSMLGIIGSAMAAYCAGRSLPENTARRLGGRRLERVCDTIRSRGLASVLAVSVAPIAPFPVVGMAAGVARIKLWQYVAGTALGMLPGTLATTVFAHQIQRVLENPARINYWVVAVVIAVLVALIAISRRWLMKIQHDA